MSELTIAEAERLHIITDTAKLSIPCEPVDRELGKDIAARLLESAARLDTDDKLGCLGLAANQLGYNARVLVIKKGKKFKAFINPTLITGRGPHKSKETCFSFPGEMNEVTRFAQITVKADGTLPMTLKGMTAIAFQHELDHLNGVLV